MGDEKKSSQSRESGKISALDMELIYSGKFEYNNNNFYYPPNEISQNKCLQNLNNIYKSFNVFHRAKLFCSLQFMTYFYTIKTTLKLAL